MLWRHQYPIVSNEVFLFFLLISLLALLLSALTATSRPRLSNVIFAITTILILVLQFNLFFEGASVLFAIVILLAFIAGRNFQQLTFAIFIALIIGAFIDARVDHARYDSEVVESVKQASLPPVIHVLLDGFIGPDGLPPQDAPQAVRSDIQEFFREYDFELYNRAYSQYHATEDSLTRAFNFTSDDANLFTKSFLLHENFSINENRYFEFLHKRGYTINIYQSESVDFCKAAPEAIGRCMIYTIPNLKTVRDNVPTALLRLKILVSNLFNQSFLIGQFLSSKNWLLSWGVTLYQPRALEELGNDLEDTRSGAYFAHLLLPHAPFVYTQDCQPDYSSESWERFPARPLMGNAAEIRAVRYLRYLDQVSCALGELGRLFDRLRESGLYDEATIVVHGDHGSRISLLEPSWSNRHKLTPEDYRDMYSTLFAIKLPDGGYREHTEPVALNVLMSRAAMKISGKDRMDPELIETSEEMPFIYLSGQSPLRRQDIDIFAKP
jgi:hypothetical protein